jgi:hypothetical protein
VVEDVRREVAAQVVDTVERNPPCDRIRLGRSDSHQQRTGQSRADRGRDDVRFVHVRGREGPAHRRAQRLEVCAGGDLGYHPAEARVLVHARGNLVGEQAHGAVSTQLGDTDAGFVA